MTLNWRHALLFGTALGLASGAQAQGQSQGQVPTREEVNPPPPTRDERPSSVSVDSSGAFPRGPCPLDNSDLRTTIPDVQFGGVGGEPLPPELVPVLAGIDAPAGEAMRRELLRGDDKDVFLGSFRIVLPTCFSPPCHSFVVTLKVAKSANS